MRSMTGFGSGEHACTVETPGAAHEPHGTLLVEVRALNHRFLEVRVRASRDLADLASHAELLARERFARGRIEVVIRGEGVACAIPLLNRERAVSAYRQLAELRDAVAPNEPVPLSLLAAVPDLFVVGDASSEAVRTALQRAFAAAAVELDAMREREGVALERDLRAHLARTIEILREIEALAPEALAATQKRLRERVNRLAASADATVDPIRFEQEVALLADRTDVAEELARLRSHTEQLGALFGDPNPVGRRLDFLLQEMMRETNTLGSKSADAAIARAVVELKVEIERMREQAQNVE
jgi:uncharacterized protein (TIGR00255 family)